MQIVGLCEFWNDNKIKIRVYSIYMAKRATGVGKRGKTHSHKTKKRIAIKREMLAAKANKA